MISLKESIEIHGKVDVIYMSVSAVPGEWRREVLSMQGELTICLQFTREEDYGKVFRD